MKGFGLVITLFIAIFATTVNAFVNNPLRRSRQTNPNPVTRQQLEAQISHLQKMLRELRSLESRQILHKPTTSQLPRRNRMARRVQPFYVDQYDQLARPYNHRFHPQDTKNIDLSELLYPYYSTQSRTRYNSFY